MTETVQGEGGTRRWPVLLLALVLAVGGVTTAGVLGMRVLGDDAGPAYPARWDERVQPFVTAVQRERGLSFEHPVFVDFLKPAEFEKQVTADESDLSDEDRDEIEHAGGELRALGLVRGRLDLLAETNKLNGAGIVGYYSYDDERIRVRGERLTPSVRSTLVHELTHALQDQYFDLGKRLGDMEEAGDDAATNGFRALVEGDAQRVETAWRASLGKAQRARLDAAQAADSREFTRDAKGVPQILRTLLAAPYTLGEGLLALAEADGGRPAVDNLFSSPPRTEEHQLDPWTLVTDHQGLLAVPAPKLPKGDEKVDDGPFGAVSWLLVLSERIPALQALDAADGWGGDAYLAYEHGGASCVRIGYRGDTRHDLEQMHAALTSWVARGPRGSAKVTRTGPVLVLRSCDPGPKARSRGNDASRQALSLAVTRTHLSAQLLKGGADPEQARCSADRVVHAFTLKQLSSPTIDPKRVREATAACRR